MKFTRQLGTVKTDNSIFLAPLAGFTDSAFRTIVREIGAGIVYTEMVSSMGLFYKDKKTEELLRYREIEHPVGAQIFGSDPDKLAYAAKIVEEKGFDLVDINMGCPTPKIVKSGSGAALLKNPVLIGRIVRAVRKAVQIPVTIKIRKGFYRRENVAKEVGKIAENEGVDAIALHGITAEEFFDRTKEDWESIRELKESVEIPVIGNGGILSEEDANLMFEKTGTDYVMVGRAALGRPEFLKSAFSYVSSGKKVTLSLKEKFYIIVRHINLEVEDKGEERGVKEMRKVVAHYIKGVRGAAYFRNMLNKIENKEELIALVKEVFSQFEEV